MKNYIYCYIIVFPSPVSGNCMLYLDRINFERYLASYKKEYVVRRRDFGDGQYEKDYLYDYNLIAMEKCYIKDEEIGDSGRMEE